MIRQLTVALLKHRRLSYDEALKVIGWRYGG
jgi:hypothetical protein